MKEIKVDRLMSSPYNFVADKIEVKADEVMIAPTKDFEENK